MTGHGHDSRRISHNEVERRRRENQRERLEELRRVLPNMRDCKSSMVSTITRAREYIQQLQTRIGDLEKMLALTQAQSYTPAAMPPQHHHHQMYLQSAGLHMTPQMLPNMAMKNQYTGHPIYPTPIQQQLMYQQQQPQLKLAPVSAPLPQPPVKKVRQGEPCLNGVTEDKEPVNSSISNVPKRTSNNFTPPTTSSSEQRSSLLLPTADPGLFLYGQRDNMSNMFAAPLAYILRQQNRPEDHVLSCGKCSEGIIGQIMIDCDACHDWFHIKCTGLDPERIPIHWTCSPNCSHKQVKTLAEPPAPSHQE